MENKNQARIDQITAAYDRMVKRMDSRWDAFGRRLLSGAAERRMCAEDRADAVATLGWEPEAEGCPPGQRWAHSTGEMWSLLLEERARLGA